MGKFNERAVLIFSVVGLFAAQLAISGYQSLSCNPSGQDAKEYCLKRNDYLSKVGESAANVLLALLVPAAYAANRGSKEK